jgi:hypothetical protein
MVAPALATRLRVYGIDAKRMDLPNLEVRANQEVLLDTDRKLGKQVVLSPKTIDEVKRWIGVPDAAFAVDEATCGNPPRPIIPASDKVTPEQSASLYKLARSYIYSHSSTVSKEQRPALDAWLRGIGSRIAIGLFHDIHVAAGGQLVVHPSILVLFAHHITIDPGGMIVLKSTQSKIDCAGIKGN